MTTLPTPKNILVTGGCGFIGTNFIRHLFGKAEFTGRIVNVDKLTYSGNPENLAEIQERYGEPAAGQPAKGGATKDRSRGEAKAAHPVRYVFVQADICDQETMAAVLEREAIDTIVHFAAESHVDRSILGPGEFVRTNIEGTFRLLEAVRARKGGPPARFHHVSTDEVYGSLGPTGAFTEETPYDPRSPYSASKAASDHLVRAYHHTYGLPVTISNCSNNYGPYQFPEKVIPVMLLNMLEGKPLPVYGDGMNVRDWLYVDDHCEAIWQILTRGRIGETYNIGGNNESTNIGLIKTLCQVTARLTGKFPAQYEALITYVKDRPGHDRRYAIDASKIARELGWRPAVTDLAVGLAATVRWYLDHPTWVEHVRSGEYRDWMAKNYARREEELARWSGRRRGLLVPQT